MSTTRARVQLPLGAGIDRESGPMVRDASAQEDLRNVHLHRGFAYLRKGSVEAAALLDPDDDAPMTEVLAGEHFKAAAVGIVVAWRESTRGVHVYRITRAGASPQHLGLWFTLAAGAAEPPRIFLGEVAGHMWMAHDEAAITLRAVTVGYDPTSGDLVPLTAAWAHCTTIDPAGAENAIRYRKRAAVDLDVTVTYVDPVGNNVPLSVAVAGGDITVTLETDGASAVVSTAAEVLAVLEADDDVLELVAAALDPDDGGLEDGSGVMTAIAETPIANDGIRFRGVTEHLGAYLAGWGYGTEREAHPEYVRMSLPTEPGTFELQHYAAIGQKGDAVLRCLSTGGTLLCFKAFEHWEHFGENRRSFGVRRLDPLVGILSSRLGIVIDQDGTGAAIAFVWTPLGPRLSNGGPLIDLAIPLALFTPEPEDLAALGNPDEAFAAFLPDRRQVRFHFGERYYAFDLIAKQWSYGELAFEPSCGFLLPGVADVAVPAGSVSDLEVIEDIEEP